MSMTATQQIPREWVFDDVDGTNEGGGDPYEVRCVVYYDTDSRVELYLGDSGGRPEMTLTAAAARSFARILLEAAEVAERF